MKMNSKVYDTLKWICTILLPALITLYSVVGATLEIPGTQAALTIAAAANACLGTCLGISNYNYKKSQGGEENGGA